MGNALLDGRLLFLMNVAFRSEEHTIPYGRAFNTWDFYMTFGI